MAGAGGRCRWYVQVVSAGVQVVGACGRCRIVIRDMSLEQRKFDAQRFFQSDFLFFSIAIFRGWSDFRMTTKHASRTTTLHSGDHQPYTSNALNFSCLKSMTFWWSEDMLWEASIFDTFCIFQLNLTRLVWSPTRTVFFGSHIFSCFTLHLHGDFDF